MRQLYHFLQARRFNRPAEQILIDLIYVANEYRLELEHTTFGKARKLDQRPDIDSDGNSFINLRVDPQFDDTFSSGNSGLVYYRIPLEVLVDGRTITINHAQPFTTHQVLDQINAQLGSQLTKHDLVDEGWEGAVDQVITLKAAEGSWVWCNDHPMTFSLNEISPLTLDGIDYDPTALPPAPPPPPAPPAPPVPGGSLPIA